MKGKLHKTISGWYIQYELNTNSQLYVKTNLPLHPADIEQITKDSLMFDNIEHRIAAYPEVDFEIVSLDNGAMSFTEGYESKTYAKLI